MLSQEPTMADEHSGADHPADADADASDARYPLSSASQAAYREQGFIKLPGVFQAATLHAVAGEIRSQVQRLNRQDKPMAARSTYEQAFLQIMNMWRVSPAVARFCASRR